MEELSTLSSQILEKDNFINEEKNYLLIIASELGAHLFHRTNMEEINSTSLSVLMSNAWQASAEFYKMLSLKSPENVRLSFDYSDRGIYVTSFVINGSRYFIGHYYSEEINPGLLKKRIRDFTQSIQENFKVGDTLTEENFENITDEEIDNLFESIGI